MAQSKRTTEAAAQVTPDVFDTVASFYTEGIDRLAEVQKKGLDMAAKQNGELIQSWKKVYEAIPGAPGLMMLDLAASAFDRYADTQKGAIDLVLTQSHALMGVVREGIASTSEARGISADLVQQAVEESVTAQKKALDDAALQSKVAFEKAKTQLGLAGTPAEIAADTLQRGVENLTASQKDLLDFAAQPLKSAKAATSAK